MNGQEIIEMAMKSGCPKENALANMDILQDFAKLVAAKEREACALICGEYNFGQAPKMIQEAIRARGEA